MFLFKMDNLFLNQPDLCVDLEHVLKENLEIMLYRVLHSMYRHYLLYIGGWKTLPNPGKNATTNNGFGKLSLFL